LLGLLTDEGSLGRGGDIGFLSGSPHRILAWQPDYSQDRHTDEREQDDATQDNRSNQEGTIVTFTSFGLFRFGWLGRRSTQIGLRFFIVENECVGHDSFLLAWLWLYFTPALPNW
jgi:hypothetical protein